MISYSDARAAFFEAALQHSLETETIPVSEVLGRVCAQEIIAPRDIQPFDNAAMDGFAVRRLDIADATLEHPVILKRTGVIAAGDGVPQNGLSDKCCIQIMTGAPVPLGADAVVPVEMVTINGDQVTFSSLPKQQENIRAKGADFCQGFILPLKGKILGAEHILPLVTLGIGTIGVHKKPRVVFLSTGRELVDDLTQDLEFGQIYNSNSSYAKALLEEMSAICIKTLTIHDNADDFASVLEEIALLRPDMVISSGAVSAGAFDFVRAGLEKSGAEILYHKVKVKPGKPNLLARLPCGALYFGLPGNPVATAVGLRFFVLPALRAMMGVADEKPLYARMVRGFTKKAGLHMFLKGQVVGCADGGLDVTVLDGQESFMVCPFLKMNAWVSVPEEVSEVKERAVVEIYPLLPCRGLM